MVAEQIAVRAGVRLLDLMFAVAERGPATLGSICDVVGLSKATAYRLLQTLAHRDVVLQDPETGLYVLGPGALIIADSLTRGTGGVGLIARGPMEELRDQSGETVILHTRLGAVRVCIAEIPSQNPLRYTSTVGTSEPIHTGSAGKVLLAYMDTAQREQLLKSLPMARVTDRTITDVAQLLVEIEAIASLGFAVSRGERAVGAAGISVPVRRRGGEVFAALSVLGPEVRMPPSRTEVLVPLLQATASRIATLIVEAQEVAAQ